MKLLYKVPRAHFQEAKTSRIYDTIQNQKGWAIISPYRTEYTEKENLDRMKSLKRDIREKGLGFTEFISRWTEDGVGSDERSLLVRGISYDDSISLGKKYEQSSIIYKDDLSCREICVTPFETYQSGDTVRTFNVSGDHVLNIEDAVEIFSKRSGGASSMPKRGRGRRPFTLKPVNEVWEVEQPRASYFQDKESCRRIL